MPLNTTNDYITSAELDAVIEATRGLKIWNDGEVEALDRIPYPTFDYAFAKSPKSGMQSIQGGYQFEVKGNRNQRINWIHGSKKLKFEQWNTPFNLKFYVGKGQLGNQQLVDFLERAGIQVKLSTELRQGGVPVDKQTVIFNVLKEEKDDLMYARRQDLARRFWTANTDATDCFYGMETLFPSTSNTAGAIGGVNRTNPLVRHQIITGVTADNVNIAFAQMERQITDAGGSVKWCVMGDNWFDMIMGLYQGTTTLRGKFDIKLAYAEAAELGMKFKINLPYDAFVGPNGVLCMREPIFKKLDSWENPAVLYANRCYMLDMDNLFLLTERNEEFVNHGMPYDQLVNYSSIFDTLCLASNKPGAQGLLIRTA